MFKRILHRCGVCTLFLVNSFSESEYDAMWFTSVVVSTVGLLLNLWMASTWYSFNYDLESNLDMLSSCFVQRNCRALAGIAHFNTILCQIRNCVFGGIVYGAIDTLPMVHSLWNGLHRHLLNNNLSPPCSPLVCVVFSSAVLEIRPRVFV
jgi:hypothetical protein